MTTEEKAALVARATDDIKFLEGIQQRRGYLFDLEKEHLSLLKIALSALTAEPVAVPDEFIDATQNDKGLFELSEDCMVRLAVALSRQQKGLVIKSGWKLVPVEPTEEMRMQIHPIAVGRCMECDREVTADCEDNVLLSWADMIAAAPTP